MRKASMVGFISNLAPLLNYLRRRSPGPPFPPDHRQTGERGAIKVYFDILSVDALLYFVTGGEQLTA